MVQIRIDLRSDTVTKPSPAMREAMAGAAVGDDVYGEDPTVNKLQERIATILHKEAALYVPSGTMSNQIAIKCHTQPGMEIICEQDCHLFNYEASGPAFNSLVMPRSLKGHYGVLDIDEVRQAIRPDNIHAGPTGLIAVENTHNRAGGTIYPLSAIQQLRVVADEFKIPLHLDGARLFNAVIATGIPAHEWAQYFDSVSICFSKGLGAPIGSIIVGTREFIRKAVRVRKIFGGGMRQVGILAAACLYALDNNIERLVEDHENARFLAERLQQVRGISIDMQQVHTNIVMVNINHPDYDALTLSRRLAEAGVGMNPVNQQKMRAVTHLDVDRTAIEETIAIFHKILGD